MRFLFPPLYLVPEQMVKVGGIMAPKSTVEVVVPLSTRRGAGRVPKGDISVAMVAAHLPLQLAEGLLFPLESGHVALLPAIVMNLPRVRVTGA
jgi:hypothetical protein